MMTGALRAFPGVACQRCQRRRHDPAAPLLAAPGRRRRQPARSGRASRRPAVHARVAADGRRERPGAVRAAGARRRTARPPGSGGRPAGRPGAADGADADERDGPAGHRDDSRPRPSGAAHRARRGHRPSAGSSRRTTRRAWHRRPSGAARPRPSDGRPRSGSGDGPRAPRDPAIEQARIEERTLETWIDEGSVRAEAVAATTPRHDRWSLANAGRHRPDSIRPSRPRSPRAAGRRSAELLQRLSAASEALDRERFDEAHRIVAPLMRQFPSVAAVHELAGLASYRVGRWDAAITELEAARAINPSVALLPVLADCYRALAAMGQGRGDLAGGAYGLARPRDRRRGAHRRRRVARRSR